MIDRSFELMTLTAAYKFSLPGSDRQLFMKLRGTDIREALEVIGRRFTVEKIALEVLAGLAVPTLHEVALEDIPFLGDGARAGLGFSAKSTSFLVESHDGPAFHQHAKKRDPHTLLGTWLFCLEQFVAFRRHQMLYTDIKCDNIVATDDPLRVIIIDFDRTIPLIGKRNWMGFGFTRGFEPPEINTFETPSEASCSYQLGMLLLHFMTNGDNRTIEHPRLGLPRLRRMFDRMGAPALAPLVARCLQHKQKARPRGFEEIYEEVESMKLPVRARAVWSALRTPYAARLAEVGL